MLFVVNKNAQLKSGEHIIHQENCHHKPKEKNIIGLGNFLNDEVALFEARRYFPCVNGCKYCCPKIHLKR